MFQRIKGDFLCMCFIFHL